MYGPFPLGLSLSSGSCPVSGAAPLRGSRTRGPAACPLRYLRVPVPMSVGYTLSWSCPYVTLLQVSRYVDPHPVAVAVGVARPCPSPFLARGLCGLHATSGRGTAATVRHHN
jgi:hypothetical protein